MFKGKNSMKRIYSQLWIYPTQSNFSYFWNFGFISFVFLVIQIISGLFLAMHYIPHIDYAFISVEHIMRDVNYGWFFRYAHSNGASLFFVAVYMHVARGLYYKSFSIDNFFLWLSGVIIFLLMVITAFIGYVLPWGQMSFWGATVITNLVSAIPVVGSHIVLWLWGGFSVSGPTLTRFFSLHFTLPFILLFLVVLHLILLHKKGGRNPYFVSDNINRSYNNLYPYFILKDFIGLFMFLVIFIYLIAWDPNLLGHSDNYIMANSLVTPEHIVPEWYFLPFYAILRSIPDKLFGVFFMILAILVFLLLPFLSFFAERLSLNSLYFNKVDIIVNYYVYPFFCNFFFIIFITLGWLGAQPVEQPFILCGQIFTFLYFFIIFLLPFVRLITSLCYRFINFFFLSVELITLTQSEFFIPKSELFNAISTTVGLDYYGEYLNFLIFLVVCILIVSILISLSYYSGTFLLSTDNEKSSTYECGFAPIKSIRFKVFNIQFFRVALLFLVFDLELLYLFPWTLTALPSFIKSPDFFHYYVIFPFIFLVAMSIFYEYMMNALIIKRERLR